MRPLPHRRVERTLRRHGFVLVRMKGSHGAWEHPDGRRTVVARHGKEIPRNTMAAILRQTKIPFEEFR